MEITLETLLEIFHACFFSSPIKADLLRSFFFLAESIYQAVAIREITNENYMTYLVQEQKYWSLVNSLHS